MRLLEQQKTRLRARIGHEVDLWIARQQREGNLAREIDHSEYWALIANLIAVIEQVLEHPVRKPPSPITPIGGPTGIL